MTRARAVTTSWRPRRPSHPMPEGGQHGEGAQTDERVDAQKGSPCRAGEGAVRDGVGREGRAAEDDEEADDPGDDGDDGGHDPGVGHESREHGYSPGPPAPPPFRWDAAADRSNRPARGSTAAHRAADQVGAHDESDDEEADGQGVVARPPVGTVVGEEHPDPGGADAEATGGDHGRPHPPGDAQGGGCRPDEQSGREDGPDGDGRQSHGHGQRQHVGHADDSDGNSLGHGDVVARPMTGAAAGRRGRWCPPPPR